MKRSRVILRQLKQRKTKTANKSAAKWSTVIPGEIGEPLHAKSRRSMRQCFAR